MFSILKGTSVLWGTRNVHGARHPRHPVLARAADQARLRDLRVAGLGAGVERCCLLFSLGFLWVLFLSLGFVVFFGFRLDFFGFCFFLWVSS